MLLEVENLETAYGASQVLFQLSFGVREGEVVTLLGRNGMGKTTIIRSIMGLARSRAGTIRFRGQRIERASARELARWRTRHVGFVFQFYNLIPVLTAERNVELPLLLTNLSKAERRKRVAIALDVVGLAERARHYPRQLSGGQEQRVGIARAIVSDPTLLLCDEPTGDLDRKSADEILGLLQTLNRDHGKTIVVVTDDVESWDLVLYAAGAIEPIAVDAFSLDELARTNPPSSRDLADGVAKVVLGCHGLKRIEPWTMSRDATSWSARVAIVPVAASAEPAEPADPAAAG